MLSMYNLIQSKNSKDLFKKPYTHKENPFITFQKHAELRPLSLK